MSLGSCRQILSLDGHNGEGRCLCTVDEDGEHIFHSGCPVTGHVGAVTRVEFSDDGSQVTSAGGDQVLVWDLASGRRVRKLKGSKFAFVEGLSDEHKKGRYLLTASGDTLLIYECWKEQQHGGDGTAAAPVACFKAPHRILSVRCHGSSICVGCEGGAVCILSAPLLTA